MTSYTQRHILGIYPPPKKNIADMTTYYGNTSQKYIAHTTTYFEDTYPKVLKLFFNKITRGKK